MPQQRERRERGRRRQLRRRRGGPAADSESPGVEVKDLGPDDQVVTTVEGCNDQDRVARQLCEAATKEDDPFLRAALWDEYNEYKKISAR